MTLAIRCLQHPDTCPPGCDVTKIKNVFNKFNAPGEHAYVSPSSFSRYLRCAASASREFLVRKRLEFYADYLEHIEHVDDPSTQAVVRSMFQDEYEEATNDGKACHSVFEVLTHSMTKATDEKVIGLLEELGASEDLVTDKVIVDHFVDLINKFQNTLKKSDWYANEIRLPLRGFNSFGTMDLAFKRSKTLCIYDLKTGRLNVPVEMNEQLLAYAVAVLDAIEWQGVDAVELGVIALRFPSNNVVYPLSVLREFKNVTLKERMPKIYALNPEATPGEHCMHCSAKLHCPEFSAIMFMRQEQGMFASDGEDSLAEVDSTELVDRFLWAKQIEKFQNDAKMEITLRFEGINAIDDDRVNYVRPRPAMKYKDEKKAIDLVKKKLTKEDQEKILEVKLASPGKARSVLGEELLSEVTELKSRRPYIKMA